MTILESRLFAALSENECRSESDINSLRLILIEMEGVVRHQDEIICRLNEENIFFKSTLMSLENLILNESQDHRNNDIRSVNAISITEESPSRDGEQVINLNKNNLSPSRTNDKIPPNDQCAGSNINNTDSTSDVPFPKQQTSSLKENLLVEQKEEINLLKNENLNVKLQLDCATNRVKNNRFADSPKTLFPALSFLAAAVALK